MKTVRKMPRSIISIILVVSLLLTSSIAAMFVSNAVTIGQDDVGAAVVEEGEVGASVDDDETVGAAQYVHWGGGNQYSQMTNCADISSGSATITCSGNVCFVINGTNETTPSSSWFWSGTALTNNLKSIDSDAWARVEKIQGANEYHIVQFWCSNSSTQVKIDFQGSPQKVTLSPAVTHVCSSLGIVTDKTNNQVSSSNEEFSLTAKATDVASALAGKSLTYTFYDESDTPLGSVTSSNGSATLSGLTQAVKSKSYHAKVAYSGYDSKTSSAVTVTNASVVEPAFKLVGSYNNNDWSGDGTPVDQIDPTYGANIYYKEVTVTKTGAYDGSNRFRFKNSGGTVFAAAGDEDSGKRKTLTIGGDPYMLSSFGNSTNNYLQINPTETGKYRIYVDQTNTSAPKVWVETDRDLFITTETTFNNYVSGGVVAAGDARVNFELAANTGFKAYKSGNIWSASQIETDRPFMLSNSRGVDYNLEYLIRSDLCTGVTLTLDHVMVGNEDDGDYVQIFKIKSNVVDSTKYTKNIILHIDTDTKEIYATATFDQTQVANTAASDSKKITYYFAKSKNDDDKNKLFGGDNGIKIYYWNNSVSPVNTNSNPGYKYLNTNSSAPYGGQVTATPVNRYGQSIDSSGTANTIYVDLSNPIAYTVGGRTDTNRKVAYEAGKGWGTEDAGINAPFWIYKAEIPSWATSFAWCNELGYPMWQYESGAWSQPAVVLNPNRVYCFYGWGDRDARKWYTIGARLDETLWDKNGSQYADEAAKFIKYEKTNVIKYNMTSDDRLNPTMNAKLVDEYTNRGIANELYFGNFYGETSSAPTFADSKKPNIWKVWNNLAQRKYDDPYKFIGYSSYFASIWDLSGGVLNLNRTSTTGGYYLNDTYQKADLPMFDYDTLSAADNGIATAVYQNVDFPFYKNTYNGITSYSYDSLSDYNRRFNETTKTYTYSGHIDPLNDMQGYKPISTQEKSFANEFIIKFYMTESGKLTPTNGAPQDIVFNFSGDDDVWVYIDGVKVLDLGGAHMISAGSINLSEMKTYYRSPAMSNFDSSLNAHDEDFATDANSMYTVDIQKLFDVYGRSFNNRDASTQHTLQMFYVERGENESNCSISFNLPQNSGLRIQNEINTDFVNPGLVDKTLEAADHDYFSYYIEDALATDKQVNKAKNHFSLTNIPAKATTAAQGGSFDLTTPVFPAENGETINRKTSQLLLTGGIGDGIASATTALSGSYFTLGGLNYKLTDAYATGEITTPLSGRTTTSSDGALFNLLYGESATFNSKITPHTWLVVKQQNTLYTPTNDTRTITRSENSVDDDVRNASRFYATTYTITDDAANKEVGRVVSENNGEVDVVAHSNDNDNGYYFSNYSDTTDRAETVAATYKFVNTPHTGTVKITKQIDPGEGTINTKATFRFTITFKNIFGVDVGETDFSAYNVKYRVYDIDGTYKDRYYFDTDRVIKLRHGQTAEILGVPAGTLYKVSEEARGGYQIESVTKKSYRSGELKSEKTMTRPEEYEASQDIDHLRKADTGSYLADFTFLNKMVAMKVVLHYYDRKMENGVPISIDTTPTTATVAYSAAPDKSFEAYRTELDDSQTLIWIDTEKYITNAVEGKLDNIVDKYSVWTTNTKAINGIKNKDQISYTHNEGTGRYDRTLTPYSEATDYDFKYHLDAYGNALAAPQDSDRWITYKDAKGKDLTAQFTDAVIADKTGTTDATVELYNKLSQIDVWVFNEPKEYTATVHGAASSGDLVKHGDVMVGNGATATVRDYYNTRFGETAGDTAIDDATKYMKQYGRQTAFTGKYPSEMTKVERVIDDYQFVGWATDPEGKNIFTNDYYCGYRIISDIDLYPVYMTNPTREFGLTITPNPKDTYIASNGAEYTRLNVTYNPYFTTGDNDPNITDIAMVNIRMANTFEVSQINLDAVRTAVQSALYTLTTAEGHTQGAHTITVTVTNKEGGADITKPVRGEYNANELDYHVSFDDLTDENITTTVKLSNKNRVTLTQTYKSSLLANNESCYKLLVLGAMKYNGTWTISNNYLYYRGGVIQ